MALPLNYHWRSLFVRRTTTFLTILVVATVVGVLTWILCFSQALSASLSVASDPRKLIVIRRGSESETNSAITATEFNRLSQVSGVKRDEQGMAVISPELMVQVAVRRKRDRGRTSANMAVRGVTEVAFNVHRTVRLSEGRQFSVGEPEVIVGRRAAEQFSDLELGKSIRLGSGSKRDFRIVGYFTAEGGPLESEIWAYLPALSNAYGREGYYSSAALLLAEGADGADVVRRIGAPPIELEAATEADYWARQSTNFDLYRTIAGSLAAVISLAAAFAVANTLYAMVAGRSREIAMLRTIGFPGRSILLGFMVEAVLLSLIGGVLGCLGCAAWLALVGSTKDMFGARTFTTLAFQMRLTPLIVLSSLGLVVLIGVVGAIAPAIRASRVQVVQALREA